MLEQRKNIVLNNLELQLAIEGEDTNLRIFKHSKNDRILIKLDKFRDYAVHLTGETIAYLNNNNKLITELFERFKQPTINDLDAILLHTSSLEIRECKVW